MPQTGLDGEQIYRILSGEILRFQIRPGTLLSEHSLCERFGLSRTPVRGVLQRLRDDGLVRIVPQKGSTVTRIHYELVSQCIYERLAIESMVLRDFIRACTPTDVEKVRHAYRQLIVRAEGYREREDFDYAAFMKADMAMHETWFRIMNKEYIWQRLTAPCSAYMRFCTLDILEGNNVEDVVREHTEMLELIDGGRDGEAEALLRRHLYGGVRRMGDLIFTKYADYFEFT